eukprot:TRINITY_DN30606_c0_g1_i1.p1 TRINITY_DN30606_c0_g1~~TRINITY_DN30606_c0_g1_i1.p1  ORF type:complete len:311 (+),score=97.79 TRINITY_DN30606_c0_g1_i1:62-934(+)
MRVCLLASVAAAAVPPSAPKQCGIPCNRSRADDCVSGDKYYNPCAFCSGDGTCQPLCGVGCRQDADCRYGGGNPCTLCSQQTFTCVNPQPLCGSFCGGDDKACLAGGNGSSHDGCSKCSKNWTLGCERNSQPQCGVVCSGENECAASKECPQCVGFYCAKPAKCGQVCVGSGQCQNNPGDCVSCIGAVCENCHGCGGSCGGDSWCCGHSGCAVCGFAKCTSGAEWQATLDGHAAAGTLADFLKQADEARASVRLAAAQQRLDRVAAALGPNSAAPDAVHSTIEAYLAADH